MIHSWLLYGLCLLPSHLRRIRLLSQSLRKGRNEVQALLSGVIQRQVEISSGKNNTSAHCRDCNIDTLH